ncbi:MULTISPECIES: CBS domain-containing protein [Halomicrobium]|uniref:CBS domain-containing protein n=2 Tax=Halomicrobium mukohataei TaxID=57705 RepID=A0A4D6KM04_9EURY|nr:MULTISPECIES: CBS domain-containing protein [Halomicrobium]ACV48170.1 putative signal transduction protein with CBS domains [Halomicrobium mukohataei DSM 12286]MBO4248064.1 CBS domain-containing protein [Halomicrobium sp. IBSBa]QCD66593.1 CBS domain-containing protein [Halomicrobium mukohataei]QFR21399.1 CBS domain-containing protein [Halomicrobium sp. ZPS1]QGA82437.1 CBS domain [Halomicrobium sp. LC1Hm]
MDDIFVGRLMTSDPVTVSPDTLVEDAAQLMIDESIGSLIVTDDDNDIRGILTSTDFVEIVKESDPKAQTTVERYMSTDVLTTTAQEQIQAVADLMLEAGIHHVPVVDETEGVIGIISTTDLTAYVSTVQTPSPA